MTTRSRIAATLGGPVLALALVACGSSGTSSTSTPEKLTKANFAQTLQKGVESKKSTHVHAQVANFLDMDGDVKYDDSGTTADIKLAQGGELKVVDGTTYMSIPPLTPAGKYFKLDKNDPTFGKIAGTLGNLGPDGAVKALQKGLKKVDYKGKTKIGSTEVSRYAVTVDVGDMGSALGLPDSSAASGSMPKTVTYDIYLDKDNLMRRTVVEVSKLKVTSDFTKWGVPVNVEAPAAGDLVKAPSLAGLGAGAGVPNAG